MKMKASSNRKETITPALKALRRAAKMALELARQTGTPCHVLENGRIVDIAKRKEKGKRKRSVPSKKAMHISH
jgi:hypothetical protein